MIEENNLTYEEYLDIIRTSKPINDNSLEQLCDSAKELIENIEKLKDSTGITSMEKELKTIEASIKQGLMDSLKEGETKDLMCCGKILEELKPHTIDASFEKHVPQYKKVGEKVEIFVNHVMEEDHYIEWILVDYGNRQVIQHFKPGEEAKVTVDFQEQMKAYSYCNKHSLWVNEKIL